MGIGIDVVDVEDVEESVARFGDRYLRRVFTPREVAACAHGANARRLAAHFAAKEATLKTFMDEDRAVGWRSVEVQLPTRGAAAVELSGPAAELARRRGIVTFAVSVTATRRHAAAVVLAESSSCPERR